jgi:hypothetical protein
MAHDQDSAGIDALTEQFAGGIHEGLWAALYNAPAIHHGDEKRAACRVGAPAVLIERWGDGDGDSRRPVCQC